jgi:hypothetical protein
MGETAIIYGKGLRKETLFIMEAVLLSESDVKILDM